MKTTTFLIFLIIGFQCYLMASSSEQKNDKFVLNETSDQMKLWSSQLGVTCSNCHNLENFKDESKPNFQKSLIHQKMVKNLQDQFFIEKDKGDALKVKVDCFMCHRGKSQPDYREHPNNLTK